jgi:hypothetical protein
MPCMPNMSNQQSYKTFTTEFVPSTVHGCSAAVSAAVVGARPARTAEGDTPSGQSPGCRRYTIQCDFEV